MNHNYIIKKAYNSTLELHDLRQTNWCTYVENILNEAHLQQAWEEQSINNRQFALLTEQLHRSYNGKLPHKYKGLYFKPQIKNI